MVHGVAMDELSWNFLYTNFHIRTVHLDTIKVFLFTS